MKTIHVAAGIIQRDGASDEILAVQRGYGEMTGMWEFPGGKVERGESGAEACARELREELQVSVTNLRDFYTIEYDYPDFHLSMQCFFCQLAEDSAEPQQNDRQLDMRWVSRRTLATLQWMPADIELIEALSNDDGGDGPTSPAEADRRGGAAGANATTASDGAAGANGHGGAGENGSAGDGHPGAAAQQRPKGAHKPRSRKRRTKKKPGLLDGIDTSDLTAEQTELVRRRAAIRKSMKGNKRANTKPEMLVRQKLREAGLPGYRLQWRVPGRPDIAYPGRKVAIFVNGCFWHRCPHCNPSMPKRNVEFWEAKFRRNTERDAAALTELAAMGWTAITIWECELKRDRIDATMQRVADTVRAAQPERSS